MVDAPALSLQEIELLRRRLRRKGWQVSEQLSEALAGGGPPAVPLPGLGKPGETPAERLRRFLDLIDSRLRAIDGGSYGRCERCGGGLPFAELEQVPWADVCRACAAAPAPEAAP